MNLLRQLDCWNCFKVQTLDRNKVKLLLVGLQDKLCDGSMEINFPINLIAYCHQFNGGHDLP